MPEQNPPPLKSDRGTKRAFPLSAITRNTRVLRERAAKLIEQRPGASKIG